MNFLFAFITLLMVWLPRCL